MASGDGAEQVARVTGFPDVGHAVKQLLAAVRIHDGDVTYGAGAREAFNAELVVVGRREETEMRSIAAAAAVPMQYYIMVPCLPTTRCSY